MKATEDKLLEKLVDTIMKDSKLETPSLDFTSNVMSQVKAPKTSDVFVYKPLIPKFAFVLVFGCFLTMLFFLEPQQDSWITQLNIERFYTNFSTSLFSFSKITIYSVVLATLLLFIQISFLKKYFDNQLKR